MKSVKLISLAITMLISFLSISQDSIQKNQEATNLKGIHIVKRTVCNPIIKSKSNKPLVIVDGKIKRLKYIKKLNPNKIESVEAIRDSNAIKRFGRRGKYGAILIKTKKSAI